MVALPLTLAAATAALGPGLMPSSVGEDVTRWSIHAVASQTEMALSGDAQVAPWSLQGRCDYSPRAIASRDTTALVLCDGAEIVVDGGEGTFRFRRGGRAVSFSGRITGSRLAVDRVVFAAGGMVAANGSCEVFKSDGSPARIACLARSGVRNWAVNFIVSRVR